MAKTPFFGYNRRKIMIECNFVPRLRCIVWDLSRSFLLRLAITIFTVILIYTMAQVNVVRTEAPEAVFEATLGAVFEAT
jgi:hypothetical protein